RREGAARPGLPAAGKMQRQASGALPGAGAIPRLLPHADAVMQLLAPAQREAVVEYVGIQAMAKRIARGQGAIGPVLLAPRLQKLPPPRQRRTAVVAPPPA